jgi:DNA-binding CsgD family transcriptional regulator
MTHREIGDMQAAMVDARAGLNVLLACAVSRHSSLMQVVLSNFVSAATDTGNFDEAGAALEWAALTATMPEGCVPGYLLFARGRLRIACGQTQTGIQDLVACGERMTAAGVTNPAVFPWRCEVADALAQLGQPEQARPYAAEQVTLARQWGAPGVLGAALRVTAILDTGAGGLHTIEESVALLRTADNKRELTRALVDHGELLVRADQMSTARQVLREALDLASEIGCPDLAERSRSAFAATGGRLRRTPRSGYGSLTTSESRIASLAATGKTNRCIAKLLFVQQRTVEIHLTNVYRKLGIGGRHQLSGAMQSVQPFYS